MHLQIDRPAPNSPIPRLVHFAGWLQTSSDRSAYTFFLNGHRQERIQYSERRDVPERESFDTFGWNFICEVSKIATADQGAVTFSIFEHGICIAVYYYTCIALEEQKQQPCLFMMHIPKSAGTSIRHAVEKLYKPQEVFCIYDDPCFAAMEIVSQLSS